MRPLTNEEFISRSKAIHGEKYNYDSTDLSNRDCKGRVVITCPVHGDFMQYTYNHLRGVGCPKCCNNTKKSSDEVIEEIKGIYGDKYIIPCDFEYVRNKSKLHMICPKHGDFYTTYTNFVKNGHGCKKCSCHVYDNDEFINDLKKLYGDNFIYDNVTFNGYRKKVTLRCTKCGKEIEIYPKRLLNGNFKCECNHSSLSSLENVVAKKLDEFGIEYVFQYKNKWLADKKPLSLDFYLPKYNIGIECQGRFHFEPYKKGDTKSIDNFNIQHSRDKKKYEICENNGIKILYYSKFKQNGYFSEIYNNIDKLVNKIITLK